MIEYLLDINDITALDALWDRGQRKDDDGCALVAQRRVDPYSSSTVTQDSPICCARASPNVMPRLRSTLMPGNSNAEVTGNVITGDSAVFVMVRSTQVSQARVNEARSPTLTRQT